MVTSHTDILDLFFGYLNSLQLAVAARVCKRWRSRIIVKLVQRHPLSSLIVHFPGLQTNIRQQYHWLESLRKRKWSYREIKERHKNFENESFRINPRSIASLSESRILVGQCNGLVYLYDLFRKATVVGFFNHQNGDTDDLLKLNEVCVIGTTRQKFLFTVDMGTLRHQVFVERTEEVLETIDKFDQNTFVAGSWGKLLHYDIRQGSMPCKLIPTKSTIHKIKAFAPYQHIYVDGGSVGVFDSRNSQFSPIVDFDNFLELFPSIAPVSETQILIGRSKAIQNWEVRGNAVLRQEIPCPSASTILPLSAHSMIIGTYDGHLYAFDSGQTKMFKKLYGYDARTYPWGTIKHLTRMDPFHFLVHHQRDGLQLWNMRRK